MLILIPIFMMLFAGWMLWGWCVGETKDIRWLRHWCAPVFVITAITMALGTGVMISRIQIRSEMRRDLAHLLDGIEQHLDQGNTRKVRETLATRNPGDDPDADAFDLLDHLTVMSDELCVDNVAVNEDEVQTIH